MSEDAAATARRIVEEVLAGREQRGRDEVSSAEQRERDEATSAEQRPTEEIPSPGAADVGPEDEPDGAAPTTEAGRIARRIVEEVLATEGAADEDGGLEASVLGVPATGLPAHHEGPVEVVVAEDPPADVVAEPPGEADDEPGPPPIPDAATGRDEPQTDVGPGSSAEEIVRRIVAEVTEHPREADADDPAVEVASAAGTGTVAPTTDDDDAPPPAPPGSSTQELDPGEQPTAASPGDDGATRMLQGGEPGPASAGDVGEPVTVGAAHGTGAHVLAGGQADVEASSARTGEATAGGAAPVGGGPLVGWAEPAEPPDPEPTTAVATPGASKPHTIRWLIASLLGAVALAVLFPLAVAALRALVALG